MHEGLLITGITYEAAKREALARGRIVCERTMSRLTAAVEAYDRRHYQTVPCTGDIMCERTGARHKAGCIGKVEPIAVFWRKVQQ